MASRAGAIIASTADHANEVSERFGRGNVKIVRAAPATNVDEAITFLMERLVTSSPAEEIISLGAEQVPLYSIAFMSFTNAVGTQMQADKFSIADLDKIADVLWKNADVRAQVGLDPESTTDSIDDEPVVACSTSRTPPRDRTPGMPGEESFDEAVTAS